MSMFLGAMGQCAKNWGGTLLHQVPSTLIPQKLSARLPRRSPINRMTVDLTDRARQKHLKKMSGRDELIGRLSSIVTTGYGFGILIGKPGVGKTALVHQLAYLAAKGTIPSLKDVRIVELSLNKVSGKGALAAFNQLIMGNVDQFVENLLEELEAINQGTTKTIVFIDEIHELLTNYQGIFETQKQKLATQGVFILGATAEGCKISEWKRNCDNAFERRIQLINVPEMSPEEAKKVLEGLAQDETHIKVTEDGIYAALELSKQYLPKGVLPDRAIKLLNQVIAWAKDKILGEVNQETVANYLSGGGLTNISTEQLLIQLTQSQRHQFIEAHFQTIYFPCFQKPTASSAPFFREGLEQLMCAFGLELSSIERPDGESLNPESAQLTIRGTEDLPSASSAVSIQPYRPKEIKILRGRSQCVLREIASSFASPERTVYICSFETLLKDAEHYKDIYRWTETFLNRLANSLLPVVLYLDAADLILEFDPSFHQPTPPPTANRPRLPILENFSSETARQFGERVLGENMASSVLSTINSDLPFTTHTASDSHNVEAQPIPLPSSPMASAPISKHLDLIRLFDQFIKDRKIDVMIGTQKETSVRFDLIRLPEMSRAQIIEWLSTSYNNQGIPFDRLLLLATQLAPHMASEDYCFKLLKGVSGDRTNEQNLLNAALTMARGAKSRTEIQQKWKVTEDLSRPIFQEWPNDAKEPIVSTELNHFLTTYSQQTLPFVWMEDPSDVQADFTQEQIARSLQQRHKRVFTLNLSHLLSADLEDGEQKRIIDFHSEVLLEGTRPVVMVKESDFKHPNLQQRLIELVKRKKIQLICFAKQIKQPSEESSLNEGVSLGGISQAVKSGIATLGLSNLVSQFQGGSPGPRSHDPKEIQAVKIENKPISRDILIRYLLTKEMGSNPGQGRGQDSIMDGYTRLYKFLGSEDGLKMSLDEVKTSIQSAYKIFSGSPSQDQIIEYILQSYGSSEGISLNRLKYAIDPEMTPLIYRIWRLFKDVVGRGVQTLAVSFTYVFSLAVSGIVYSGSASLITLFRRFLLGP